MGWELISISLGICRFYTTNCTLPTKMRLGAREYRLDMERMAIFTAEQIIDNTFRVSCDEV